MKLVSNTGSDRVIDHLTQTFQSPSQLDMLGSTLSLYAYEGLRSLTRNVKHCRAVVPANILENGMQGGRKDRSARNRLQGRWLASQLAKWIASSWDLRSTPTPVTQGAFGGSTSNSPVV